MKQTNTYNVFIASPSDVQAERQIVHEVCQTLYKTNPLVKDLNIRFETSGWEELMPQGGKAQDIIDIIADDCDLFICIMHTKFGTPINGVDSGTQWEFLNAYEKWATKKEPHIMLYFKEIKDSDATTDMKKMQQMMKVMNFKKELNDNYPTLYKNFTDEKAFSQTLTKDLTQFISKNKPQSNKEENSKDTHINRKTINKYYRFLEEHYSHLDANRLQAKGKAVPISLPEIFIPLYANDPNLKEQNRDDFEKDDSTKDLKQLIEKNEHILIEAGAGSGKTTLLKHLTYTISTNTKEGDLKEYFPVLILLRDLNELFNKNANPSYIEVLSWYFKEKLDGIIDDADIFIKSLIENEQKILFLLDGFDELQTQKAKDKIANIFFTLKTKEENIKLVLTSRPHGITPKIAQLCSEKHTKIHILTKEQQELFIEKWFKHYKLQKTALEMISQIQSHPAISKLIENPLMLTAICILYFDAKVLPEQRAELYGKFIENMIYRRFESDEAIFIENFIRTLSFRTHEKRNREFSMIDAVNILVELDEEKTKTNEQWKEYFEEIEPSLGLLKYENGAYLFWHLSFQEYLTARYILNNTLDQIKEIEKYIDDDWYKEVVELYIGYLSISSKPMANKIIKNLMEVDTQNPHKRWLLGARAINDIIKSNRDTEVLKIVKIRLEKIIKNTENIDHKVEAGELLGKLGDTRDLEEFVEVGDISISKYPVTNGWYKKFIEDGGYKNKSFWSQKGWNYIQDNNISKPLFWDHSSLSVATQPAVAMSWYEAKAFCNWLNKNDPNHIYELPSEDQWQKVAQGNEKRKFPWGNEWNNTKCNNGQLGIDKTTAVGIFEDGNTPEGIADMSGNIWEWTNSSFDKKNKDTYVLLGGSWSSERSSDYSCSNRNSSSFASSQYVIVGFRCIRTPSSN